MVIKKNISHGKAERRVLTSLRSLITHLTFKRRKKDKPWFQTGFMTAIYLIAYVINIYDFIRNSVLTKIVIVQRCPTLSPIATRGKQAFYMWRQAQFLLRL